MRLRRLYPKDITGIEYKEFMYSLRKKKRWTCERCGWRRLANECYITEIDVHHINRNSTDHRLENLKVLCRDCHDIVHKVPLSYKRRKIIKQRKIETEERKNRPRRQYSENGWPI